MAGVNTGGEDIYRDGGKPDHRTHYEQVDGRGKPMVLPEMPHSAKKITDGGNCSYTVAITNANQIFALPVPGDEYTIIANGNTAYCRMGGGGVVATTAVGGYDFPVGDGIHFRCRPGYTHIGFIATATAGAITFIHHREP